ncbi:hypothetical protein DM860_004842 [Cuscuta australis]|uniref:Uncharacterized protein n=1 Tax=Cuscuta australis TaxID=267555 RepID=A0A328DRF9_9ASTE|nr:hypothetical protein DM860_004842 [Cuscuta australis]
MIHSCLMPVKRKVWVGEGGGGGAAFLVQDPFISLTGGGIEGRRLVGSGSDPSGDVKSRQRRIMRSRFAVES